MSLRVFLQEYRTISLTSIFSIYRINNFYRSA